MFKILSKIFSLFASIVSLLAILISFWAYFIVKKFTLSVFILATLFFGFIFVFELYNLFKENASLKSFLLTNKINFQFLLYNLGSLIFAGIFLYLAIAKIEDVSKFDQKLFLVAALFLLISPFLSFLLKFKGIKKYYELPVEKREDVEKRISFLSKIEPIFILVVTIAIIIYFLIRK